MALNLLSREEVKRRVSLSTATLYLRIKAGSFPRPVRLGENRVAWVESEIDAWINALAAQPRERKAAPPPPKNGYRGGRRPRKADAVSQQHEHKAA